MGAVPGTDRKKTMNLLQQIEQEQVQKLTQGKEIPDFRAGDTVRVHVKVVEGDRQRIQPYEGVVIGRKLRGLNSSFRVRKISNGEGVERVFPLHSPNIRIEVIRHGSYLFERDLMIIIKTYNPSSPFCQIPSLLMNYP